MLEYLRANPELAALLATTVIWPLLTGLLSLGYASLEERAPRLVAFLRAAGLDASSLAPLFARLVRAALKLPPQVPPALVLLFVASITGCAGATAEVARYAEASRDVVAYAEPCMRGALEVDLARCSTPECVDAVEQKWSGPMSALDLVKAGWCALSPSSEGCK